MIISDSSADMETRAVFERSPEFLPYPPAATDLVRRESKADLRAGSSIRSWGRLGPATLGLTVARSSSTTEEKSSASFFSAMPKRPWARK